MSLDKYHNPRSNRKQKAKAKRQAREMLQSMVNYDLDCMEGAVFAQSPDEFLREEQKGRALKTECTRVKKEKPLKEGRSTASGKETISREWA